MWITICRTVNGKVFKQIFDCITVKGKVSNFSIYYSKFSIVTNRRKIYLCENGHHYLTYLRGN